MAKFSSKDQMLLSEAYAVTLLKESIPGMSLKQVTSNLDLMTESEAEYVSVVLERLNDFIISEGLFGNVKSGLASVGKAAGAGLASVGKAVGGSIANKTGQVVQGAKNIGAGVGAAASQVGKNVNDMYQTGVQDKRSLESVAKADELSQQLIDLLTQAQQAGLIKAQGAIVDMTLADIANELATAKQSAQTFNKNALNTGFSGGVKQAFNQGRQASA
jgi:hypothetical protein